MCIVTLHWSQSRSRLPGILFGPSLWVLLWVGWDLQAYLRPQSGERGPILLVLRAVLHWLCLWVVRVARLPRSLLHRHQLLLVLRIPDFLCSKLKTLVKIQLFDVCNTHPCIGHSLCLAPRDKRTALTRTIITFTTTTAERRQKSSITATMLFVLKLLELQNYRPTLNPMIAYESHDPSIDGTFKVIRISNPGSVCEHMKFSIQKQHTSPTYKKPQIFHLLTQMSQYWYKITTKDIKNCLPLSTENEKGKFSSSQYFFGLWRSTHQKRAPFLDVHPQGNGKYYTTISQQWEGYFPMVTRLVGCYQNLSAGLCSIILPCTSLSPDPGFREFLSDPRHGCYCGVGACWEASTLWHRSGCSRPPSPSLSHGYSSRCSRSSCTPKSLNLSPPSSSVVR